MHVVPTIARVKIIYLDPSDIEVGYLVYAIEVEILGRKAVIRGPNLYVFSGISVLDFNYEPEGLPFSKPTSDVIAMAWIASHGFKKEASVEVKFEEFNEEWIYVLDVYPGITVEPPPNYVVQRGELIVCLPIHQVE